jgi:hypothetical protein
MSNWSWGKQGALGIGSTLLGMIGGHNAQRRQHRDTKELMGMQHKNQRNLNQMGHDLQMDMWNKTNYKAQVDHMLEAGLNPALMYGSAGQGGQTGSQGGGSASMGQAQQMKMMDMQNLMMGAQMEKLKSEAKLNDANAKAINGYKKDESGSVVSRNEAQARGASAKALLDEQLGKAISENEKKYVDGLIGQWEASQSEAELKKIALGMAKNGIHSKEIATVLGTLTGWDLTKPGIMKEEVGILPDVLMNALEKAGIGEFNPKMTRQALLQSAVGLYMAGKLALGQLENVFGKVGDVVDNVTTVRGKEVGRTTITRKRK